MITTKDKTSNYPVIIEDLCRTTIEYFPLRTAQTVTFHYIIFLINCWSYEWDKTHIVDPKSFYSDRQGPKVKYLHTLDIDPENIDANQLPPVRTPLNKQYTDIVKSIYETYRDFPQYSIRKHIEDKFPGELAQLEARQLRNVIRRSVVSYWQDNNERFTDLVNIWNNLDHDKEEIHTWLGLNIKEYKEINKKLV